ncbi:MAG: precorrin-2 dehydrogenase/sirohydrochlorin ferrochelatase family protein, partial [Rhodanobacteraceae bacterium]
MYAYAPSQSSAPLFPLFADLGGRAVLVVGGGKVARRKVEALLEAGAAVTIVAAALEPGLNQLALLGRIRQHRNAFDPAQLDGVWLVVAASDDRRLNREVADAAAARQIFANVVDDAELSSVHAPA